MLRWPLSIAFDLTKNITRLLGLLFDCLHLSHHLQVEGGENYMLRSIACINLYLTYKIRLVSPWSYLQQDNVGLVQTKIGQSGIVHLPIFVKYFGALISCFRNPSKNDAINKNRYSCSTIIGAIQLIFHISTVQSMEYRNPKYEQKIIKNEGLIVYLRHLDTFEQFRSENIWLKVLNI